VNGCRFSVKEGKLILEDAGLKQLLVSADELPQPSASILRTAVGGSVLSRRPSANGWSLRTVWQRN
jgi:hypothetical protein